MGDADGDDLTGAPCAATVTLPEDLGLAEVHASAHAVVGGLWEPLIEGGSARVAGWATVDGAAC